MADGASKKLTGSPYSPTTLGMIKATGTGALTGAAPGLAAAGITALSPAGRASREQLQKDISALRGGKLGLTAAQKRGMLGASLRGIDASTKGAEAGLRREAAALGGTGRSGRQIQAIGALGKQKAEAAVQSQAAIDQLSQQQAVTEKARILKAIEAKRQEIKQDAGAIASGALRGAAYAAEEKKKEQEELGAQNVEDTDLDEEESKKLDEESGYDGTEKAGDSERVEEFSPFGEAIEGKGGYTYHQRENGEIIITKAPPGSGVELGKPIPRDSDAWIAINKEIKAGGA